MTVLGDLHRSGCVNGLFTPALYGALSHWRALPVYDIQLHGVTGYDLWGLYWITTLIGMAGVWQKSFYGITLPQVQVQPIDLEDRGKVFRNQRRHAELNTRLFFTISNVDFLPKFID